MKGLTFDTNIFNAILDGSLDIGQFKGLAYITHIQHDELQNTKDPTRKHALLKIFDEVVTDESSIDTESFVLDVSRLNMAKLGGRRLPTESAIWDVSRYGQAKWTPEDSIYQAIKDRLDSFKKKQNNIQDALIAETAIKNGLALVTNDQNLCTVAKEFGGTVKNLEEITK